MVVAKLKQIARLEPSFKNALMWSQFREKFIQRFDSHPMYSQSNEVKNETLNNKACNEILEYMTKTLSKMENRVKKQEVQVRSGELQVPSISTELATLQDTQEQVDMQVEQLGGVEIKEDMNTDEDLTKTLESCQTLSMKTANKAHKMIRSTLKSNFPPRTKLKTGTAQEKRKITKHQEKKQQAHKVKSRDYNYKAVGIQIQETDGKKKASKKKDLKQIGHRPIIQRENLGHHSNLKNGRGVDQK